MLPALRLLNLSLLIAYPAAWLAPLATARILPWFGGSEISIVGGVRALGPDEPLLAALIALFAMVLPFAKTMLLLAVQMRWLGIGALPTISAIGRLSMADVFLVALYIVVAKGVGVGTVQTAWGIWLFTGCVLSSLLLGWMTERALRRDASTDG